VRYSFVAVVEGDGRDDVKAPGGVFWIDNAREAGWVDFGCNGRRDLRVLWEMQGGKMTSMSEHSPSHLGRGYRHLMLGYLPILESLEFVVRRLEFLEARQVPHACCPLEVS